MTDSPNETQHPPPGGRLGKATARRGLFIPLAVIAIISFAVYFNALFNDFVYDDMTQVLQNRWIRDVRHLPDMFLRSVWSFQGEHTVSNYYRPMMHVIYLITYSLFGLKAWGFHLVNVLFHAGNAVLVFIIASRLIGNPEEKVKVKAKAEGKSFSVLTSTSTSAFLSPPFIAALLFAAHPIHTEAVAWVAGLPDVSFTFFSLLSFCFYISPTSEKQVHKWRYILSVVSFSFAAFCKEPALTLPAVLMAYDYLFGKNEDGFPVRFRRYIPYLLIAVVYLLLRFHALGGFAPERRHTDLSAYQYIINIFPLFMQYLGKLLLPVNLNAFYVLHPVASLFDLKSMAALAVTVLFIFFAFLSWKKDRTVLLSLFIIVVPLLPALYIPGLGENTFAERYLYLPSFGFVLLISFAITRIKTAARGTVIASFLLAAVAGLYAFAAMERNYVWKDNYSLFSETVKKSPDAAIPYSMLGHALADMGRFDTAIENYDKAIALSPSVFEVYNNRGLAFSEIGQTDKAMADFDKAIGLNPRSYEAYNNQGKVYGQTGLFDKAIEQFSKAIDINPDSSLAYGNRGLAYSLIGEYDKALGDLNRAVESDEHNAEAYGARGNLYLRAGDRERAVSDFQRACDLGDEKGCEALQRFVR